MDDDSGRDMTAAVRQAVWEIRRMLDRVAGEARPSRPLLGIRQLLDRLDFTATEEPGLSAFTLDERRRRIEFRSAALRAIVERVRAFALMPLGEDGLAQTRIVQTATNLFVLHELLHVVQNFPDFHDVAVIKDGLGSLGLPVLDVAADAAAAWACARIECDVASVQTEQDFLRQYVNALVLSYVILAFTFDVIGRAEKMQRALGLLMSAVLIQAKLDGYLDESKLYVSWEPASPLYAFDIERARNLNALVLDKVPGLLMVTPHSVTQDDLAKIWNGIGRDDVGASIQSISEALFAARVLREPPAIELAQLERFELPQSRPYPGAP